MVKVVNKFLKYHERTRLHYFTGPDVRLIGMTQIPKNNLAIKEFMDDYGLTLKDRDDFTDPQFIPEFAGRFCYYAFGDNSHTPTNAAYLGNIIDHKHYSVLEHLQFVFVIRGASRGFTHEIVRHRHLSFSQFSTRYCKTKNMAAVIPPLMRHDQGAIDQFMKMFKEHMETYNYVYDAAKNEVKLNHPEIDAVKLSKIKTARGVARETLPIFMEAPIVISGNLRAWREVIDKRASKYAELQIREIALKILSILLSTVYNGIFDQEYLIKQDEVKTSE